MMKMQKITTKDEIFDAIGRYVKIEKIDNHGIDSEFRPPQDEEGEEAKIIGFGMAQDNLGPIFCGNMYELIELGQKDFTDWTIFFYVKTDNSGEVYFMAEYEFGRSWKPVQFNLVEE
jgi:hypothetical protein